MKVLKYVGDVQKAECLERDLCTGNVPLMKRDTSGSLEIFQFVDSETTLYFAERALTIVLW